MEGAASANGGAALPGGANGSKDAEEASANQMQDEGLAAANGNAPLQGSANEDTRSCGSSNQDAETREVTNGSKEPQAANEDAGCKSSTNEDTEHKALANEDAEHKAPSNQDTADNASTNQNSGHKAPANQDSGHKSPANQDTAMPSTNQNTAHRLAANERVAPPFQDPTNDLTPLAAAANQALDPWDWSLEEAWLRAPEEEGQEAWGAELEGWEAEPEEEEELEDWEAELENFGAEPIAQGAELKGQGVEPKVQGAELEQSKSQEVGLKAQGAELKTHGADPNDQEAEPKTEWAEPAHPPAGRWRPSPDGAWSKLTVLPGRGLARPGPGSVCRVRLSVPPRCGCPWGAPAAAAGLGRWQSVRLGAAEGRWAALLDAALESMAAGERAWLRPAGGDGATILVGLGRFTPAPAFWSAPPAERWRAVDSGRARAARLLSLGLLGPAGRAFRRGLRAAVAAAGPPPPPAALRRAKAELHAGLAQVQLRLGQPAAAAANAGKALALRPALLEARYARGLARAAMMDLEAARDDLQAVLRARPGHAGAARELGRVRHKARERDAQLSTRLGKMFA